MSKPPSHSQATWWRWLVVLPAAVAAYVGIQVVAWLVMRLMTSDSDDIIEITGPVQLVVLFFRTYVEAAVKYVVAPWGFVAAGVGVAPSFKRLTAILLVLTVIAVLLLELVTIWGYAGRWGWGIGARGSAPLWWVTAMCAVGIVVVGLVGLNWYKDRGQKQ